MTAPRRAGAGLRAAHVAEPLGPERAPRARGAPTGQRARPLRRTAPDTAPARGGPGAACRLGACKRPFCLLTSNFHVPLLPLDKQLARASLQAIARRLNPPVRRTRRAAGPQVTLCTPAAGCLAAARRALRGGGAVPRGDAHAALLARTGHGARRGAPRARRAGPRSLDDGRRSCHPRLLQVASPASLSPAPPRPVPPVGAQHAERGGRAPARRGLLAREASREFLASMSVRAKFRVWASTDAHWARRVATKTRMAGFSVARAPVPGRVATALLAPSAIVRVLAEPLAHLPKRMVRPCARKPAPETIERGVTPRARGADPAPAGGGGAGGRARQSQGLHGHGGRAAHRSPRAQAEHRAGAL
jgi:hypothetical protein